MGLAAVGLFLGPLVPAVGGAALGGPGAVGQLVGAVLGLATGAALAAGLFKVLGRGGKETP